ncbi:hypothetical protein [Blastococcus sp. SYSU D00820]
MRFSRPVGAVLTGAAAMAASDGTAAALGVTDPRTWTAADWAADAVPHLAYGAAVQAVLEAVPTERERRTPRAPAGAGLALRSAALGVASGARSSLGLSGPTLSAPAGAVPPLRRLVSLAAVAGELVADKNPATPDRTDPPALGARFLGAAVGAGRLAGRDGANGAVPVLAAAAGAAVGAFGGIGWRRWAAARIPATRAALVEDGVALLLAAVACLPGRSGTGRPRLVVVPRG